MLVIKNNFKGIRPYINKNNRVAFDGFILKKKFYNNKGLYNHNNKNLLIKDIGIIELSEHEAKELDNFRNFHVYNINNLYKRIVSNKEKLLFLKNPDKEIPYIIVTKTTLLNSKYSYKYLMAIVYAFNDMFLEKHDVIPLNINSYEDLNKVIGKYALNIKKTEKKKGIKELIYSEIINEIQKRNKKVA